MIRAKESFTASLQSFLEKKRKHPGVPAGDKGASGIRLGAGTAGSHPAPPWLLWGAHARVPLGHSPGTERITPQLVAGRRGDKFRGTGQQHLIPSSLPLYLPAWLCCRYEEGGSARRGRAPGTGGGVLGKQEAF